MTILHVNIADADRHEPKGISTATAGQVYVADGAASGDWSSPVYGELIVDANTGSFTPVAADITQYKKLTNANNVAWEAGITSGVTLNTDDITLTSAGTYQIDLWLTIVSSASDGTDFAVKYAINGTLGDRKLIVQKNSAGSDIIHMSAVGLASFTANQVLSVWLASTAATALVIQDAGLVVTKLS
jgi:hypothetical protein